VETPLTCPFSSPSFPLPVHFPFLPLSFLFPYLPGALPSESVGGLWSGVISSSGVLGKALAKKNDLVHIWAKTSGSCGSIYLDFLLIKVPSILLKNKHLPIYSRVCVSKQKSSQEWKSQRILAAEIRSSQ